jgi:tetratricopeptide (TPR) repeat protein
VFVAHVRAADAVYTSLYPGPPFPAEGVDALPPEQAAERLAAVDARAYDARGRALETYRRRAAARPDRAGPQHELALMIWFHHFLGSPGPVEEAEPPLRRALTTASRSAERLGLLGEVLLRAGRNRDAARAFEEAARLSPGHPRFHYCASVACASAGKAQAARRHLARARRVAGPRLKHRFTPASNPLEDYRLFLVHEVGRLRQRHEGLVRESDRELAERCRSENEHDVRASRVPRYLRSLVPLAAKWGVGDDGARGYLTRRATRQDKEELRRALRDHGGRISSWLDTVLPDRPSPESGAFLYLLEACEEMGLG